MGIASFLKSSFGSLCSETQYGFCDGLRALAVIWVCSLHACQVTPMSNLLLLFTIEQKARWSLSVPLAGGAGVDVFFVLSGFLIGSSLQRELRRTGHIRFGTFLCRRTFRIFPALYSALLITAVVSWVMGKPQLCPPPAWWQNLFLVNNYLKSSEPNLCLVQTWSISVEFQQYLATPLLFCLASGLARLGRAWGATRDGCTMALCVLGWAACCGSRLAHLASTTLLPVGPDAADLYLYTQYRCAPYLAGLLAGMAAARQREQPAAVTASRPAAAALGAVLFCAAAAVTAYAALFGVDDPKPWWLPSDGVLTAPLVVYGTFARPMFGACLAYLMHLCASGRAPRMAWFLGLPAWRPVARLSYSMYLLQSATGLDILAGPRDAILNAFGNDSLKLLVLAVYMWAALWIVGTIPLALLNYVLVERPGMRAGQYLLELRGRCAGPAAPAAARKPAHGGGGAVDLEANDDLEANADSEASSDEVSTAAGSSVAECEASAANGGAGTSPADDHTNLREVARDER